jgi:hypothetical protein
VLGIVLHGVNAVVCCEVRCVLCRRRCVVQCVVRCAVCCVWCGFLCTAQCDASCGVRSLSCRVLGVVQRLLCARTVMRKKGMCLSIACVYVSSVSLNSVCVHGQCVLHNLLSAVCCAVCVC